MSFNEMFSKKLVVLWLLSVLYRICCFQIISFQFGNALSTGNRLNLHANQRLFVTRPKKVYPSHQANFMYYVH